LHWKTEYDDGVSYASSEDNIIIQDLKVAASDQEELAVVREITDDWTQSESYRS
jgi:mannitol/fructose-specific phosphotransferase system IIA component